MNEKQKAAKAAIEAHMTALSAYHAAQDAELAEPEEEDLDAPAWHAYYERDAELRSRYRVDELREARTVAEDALIQWAGEMLSTRLPEETRILGLEPGGVMLETLRRNMRARARLIDLALRYSGVA